MTFPKAQWKQSLTVWISPILSKRQKLWTDDFRTVCEQRTDSSWPFSILALFPPLEKPHNSVKHHKLDSSNVSQRFVICSYSKWTGQCDVRCFVFIYRSVCSGVYSSIHATRTSSSFNSPSINLLNGKMDWVETIKIIKILYRYRFSIHTSLDALGSIYNCNCALNNYGNFSEDK